MTTVLGSLIKKEMLRIVRDRRTMLITIFMPLLLLLLFGFAISTEINNIRIVSVVDRHTDLTREILGRLDENEYFSYLGSINPDEIDRQLRSGTIDAVILLRNNAGNLSAQIIVDASNPVVGQSASAYIRSVVSPHSSAPVIIRTLYNPQLKSSYNFVPGIMGMIFILICAIMTSVSIVSEKESGSMDLLLVSPARSGVIIFGKLVPYFLLSCVILAIMLILSYTVLGLPSANLLSVVAVSLLYVVLSLSIGLLISTLVSNQLSALVISAVLFMLPVILLSGMIFPVDNMPPVLQGISCAIPARWFISALRKLMIQQLSITYVVKEVIILSAMTAVLLVLAIRNFNPRKS